MERIYSEDIDRCLEFANEDAAAAVSSAVHSNSLCINPVTDFSNVPRDCTLLQVQSNTIEKQGNTLDGSADNGSIRLLVQLFARPIL